MKASKIFFFLFVLVISLLLMAAAPAHVLRADVPPIPWLDVLVALAAQFPTLPGAALIVAALLNILKLIPGLVRDGTADTWKNYISLGVFLVLAGFGIFKPDYSTLGLDAVLANIATVLTYIAGFFGVAAFAGVAHRNALRGLPLLGTSFSKKK